MENAEVSEVRQWIRQARDGDAAARERLFEACRSYLHFTARAQVESWLKVKVDASDVVQQTMMEAYRDFERFQGETEAQWLAWLKRILKHNVSDFIRHYRGTAKRQERREVAFRDPADTQNYGAPEPEGREATPSQELVRLDNELRVSLAISRLSPDHQEVIVLRNLQRLPFSEVAERMERSRPAVQMLWTRAIKALQAVMSEEE